MNSRIKKKKYKKSLRKVSQKELNKKKQRVYYQTSDRTFIHGILKDENLVDLDYQTEVAMYKTKPSREETDFYNKYGVPKEDTWSADWVLIPYIIELINATIEAGDIVNWDYNKVDIPVVDENGEVHQKKDVTVPECVAIITDYFKEYIIDFDTYPKDVDYANLKKKLVTGFTILGIITPTLWW